ncbi:MAG: Nramp family divalent metal transporter, partial [Gaiellaceae bacterium]
MEGWQSPVEKYSLPENHASIAVAADTAPQWRKLLSYAGLGFIISVGYMDPGNWATDIAGGSLYGYTLLSVVLLSSMAAMFLQHLSLKLGVASDRDLAQACRDAYRPGVNFCLWVLAEMAIAATDLAEVIGSAIALNILFGLELWIGVLITASDVLVILLLQARSFRYLEFIIFCLCFIIAVCFIAVLVIVNPNWALVARGLVPNPVILTDPGMLFVAIGILGATVMPHNLYLHSSVIQTRKYERSKEGKRLAIKYGTWDSSLSLTLAFFINAAILIMGASVFYYGSNPQEVADISVASKLLEPALGSSAAPILFGVALLAAGQNSTITGTLAGQIVMEGFLRIRLKPWLRRLITRGIAIVPAAITAALMGKQGLVRLLVLSQVILSLQLSFAVVPLVHFTSSRKYMGSHANGRCLIVFSWILAAIFACLNILL